MPGEPLSEGTSAVTSTLVPRGDEVPGVSEWTMHRDGKTVAHLRREPPQRRKGVRLPEVVRALTEMGPDDASWTAVFEGLELMCRVAGISPAAADLGGELLGGILVAPWPDELDARVPEPPKGGVRPAIRLDDDQRVVVVRTDFSNDAAWAGLLEALAQSAFADDVDVDVHAVTGQAWAGASPDEILAALPPHALEAVFIADATAMNTRGTRCSR